MKKNKFLVPGCIILSIVIFITIIYSVVNSTITANADLNQKTKSLDQQITTKQEEAKVIERQNNENEMKLKSIKQMYQTTNGTASNMSVFGPMFNDIIKAAQTNKLMIRSIEYQMQPVGDAILNINSTSYNACELNLFLVGTYPQLRNFLNQIVNDYNYLISISNLEVTAFSGDTNYILANTSIVLYSKLKQ